MGWALLAVVLVAAVTVTAAALVPSGRRPSATFQQPGTPREIAPATPGEIVGWTSSDNLVVMSTKTGAVLRTLATDVDIFAPGIPNVSIAPDGTVFFESATPSLGNNESGGDELFSVPISGGPVRDLGPGSDPQVSPDGRALAFISPDPEGGAGEAPYLVPPVGINVAALSSGSIGSVRTLAPGPEQLNQGVSDLSWSSDSLHLSFDLLNPATNATTAWTLATGDASSLAAATRMPLAPGLSWNGYWGDAHGGADVGLGVLHASSGADEIVSIDPRSGRTIHRLFRVPGALFPDFSKSVIGDSAGSNVLVAGVTPVVGGTPTTSGTTYLYRWKLGYRHPVRVADNVLVVSWAPIRSR